MVLINLLQKNSEGFVNECCWLNFCDSVLHNRIHLAFITKGVT